MAALPDTESSGIVSLVLETVQPSGVVVAVGWGVTEPRGAGCNLKRPLGSEDMGVPCSVRASHPVAWFLMLSGHNAVQKTGISPLSGTQFCDLSGASTNVISKGHL